MIVNLRVGLLGMGRIASGFDSPDGPDIYTHLKGILADPRFSLIAVADADVARAANELHRFGVVSDVVTPDALLAAELDVICIATPDETHLGFAERALSGTARLVLIEKPLTGDAARRRQLMAAMDARGKSVAVNHLRRWIPGLTDWLTDAGNGNFGEPVSAVAYYTRGFRHNGVHALDLVAACLGAVVRSVTSLADPVDDLSNDDMTRSLHVSLDVGGTIVPFILIAVDGRYQTAFDLDIRFSNASVHVFDQDGVRAALSRAVGPTQPGFSPELKTISMYHDSPAQLPKLLWKNIADHLEDGSSLLCDGTTALVAYDFADSILEHLPR